MFLTLATLLITNLQPRPLFDLESANFSLLLKRPQEIQLQKPNWESKWKALYDYEREALISEFLEPLKEGEFRAD